MPSQSLKRYRRERAERLDPIAGTHAAVGGTSRGRRYATQQINHAYVVLLSSEFQGFCRELYLEAVEALVSEVEPRLQDVVRANFKHAIQLKRSNAQPSSIGSDFGRLLLPIWDRLRLVDARTGRRLEHLEAMNRWRNAIAHQDFSDPRLSGATAVNLTEVRQWRSSCNVLARQMDRATYDALEALLGTPPW
jgi:hypothetical protein